MSTFDECIADTQLVLSEETFEEFGIAREFCETFPEGDVVSFKSLDEYNRLTELTDPSFENIWVGLFDDGNNGNEPTSRF